MTKCIKRIRHFLSIRYINLHYLLTFKVIQGRRFLSHLKGIYRHGYYSKPLGSCQHPIRW